MFSLWIILQNQEDTSLPSFDIFKLIRGAVANHSKDGARPLYCSKSSLTADKMLTKYVGSYNKCCKTQINKYADCTIYWEVKLA